MAAKADKTKKKLNLKEKKFADSFLIHLNKSRAAIASGSAANSSRQQGHQIYMRTHVKAYIEKKLAEHTLGAEETIKLISDTAQATITDYFKPVMVPYVPKVKKPVAELIAERKEYVAREMEFLSRSGFTETQYDEFVSSLQPTKNSIIRLEIELEKNPKAFRIVDGEEVLIEEMQLDINAIVADKEKGKVKKIKALKDGTLEVELYSAADAQEKLMKMFGKYQKDNEQNRANVSVTITGMVIK